MPADAFDDLVKQAVHAANAAAQERADYFASVAAAEMAAAIRGRVASKRGKRQSSSPKVPKRLSWASAEQLVQQRVFSKVCSQKSSSMQSCVLSCTARTSVLCQVLINHVGVTMHCTDGSALKCKSHKTGHDLPMANLHL